MPRLDNETWSSIRQEWEDGELVTFKILADNYKIDPTNIGRRAAKEGWHKKKQFTAINEIAQRKADARMSFDGNKKEFQRRRTDAGPSSKVQAEDIRADVLIRHRREWEEFEKFRHAALNVMKKAHVLSNEKKTDKDGDSDLLEAYRLAKISMDTVHAGMRALAIKQSAEVKAWGIDSYSDDENVKMDSGKEDALDSLYADALKKIFQP